MQRGAWGLGDQAVSSLTNFIMSFAVLRGLSIATFGAFAIAYSLYTAFLGLTRGAISETLVVRFSDVPRAEWRRAAAAATGAALPAALVAAVATGSAGWLIGGDVGPALVALAIVLPGLLLQDVWRFAFFAAGSPRQAFVNDTVWGVLQVGGVVAVLASGTSDVAPYVLAWGLAGVVAGVFGVAQARTIPAPRSGLAWVRRHRDLTGRYLTEAVFRRGTPQVMLVSIGAIAGLEALGALSAARVLLGPINVVYLGFVAIGVPEAVRIWSARPARLLPAARAAAATLATLAVLLATAILAVPSRLGERLLATWDEALTFMVPVAVTVAAAGVIHAMIVGLRALQAAERSLRTQLVMSALIALGGVGGAVVAGGWGAAIGWAVAQVSSAIIVSIQLGREAGQRSAALAT